MSGADLPLSPEDVAGIVAILDGSAYDRIEIRTARFTLKVAREAGGWTQEWATAADPAPVAAPEKQGESAESEGESEGFAVRAPLPGTFYRAPQPGAPPFVEIGDTVAPDSVVGIVETMKLMNPVYAGAHGTLAAILIDNAAPVEVDAILMRVAPAA